MRVIVRFALITVLAIPQIASAAPNYWPTSANPSNTFGWNLGGQQYAMDAIPDDSGGYFVAWDDGFGGHLQHVLANGSTAWPFFVYQPPGATSGFMNPDIALDGSGGVLLAFETHGGGAGDELRLQRVGANGAPVAGWPTAGVPVSTTADYDYLSNACADGEGGAFVAFIRSGAYEVYVQHILSTGVIDPKWPSSGLQVQQGGDTFLPPRVFSDGEGGVMIFYMGSPNGNNQILVSRADRDGNLRTDLFPGSGLAIANAPLSNRFDAIRTLDGLFGVVWADGRTGSNEIYIDVLDGNGRTGAAPPGGLNLSNNGATDDQLPALATNEYRDFLVAWSTGGTIRAARRQQDLTLHPEFPAGTAVVGTGLVISVSIDDAGAGDMVVGWMDINSGQQIRVQRLSRTGSLTPGWPQNGAVLAASNGSMGYFPVVVSDGDGGVIGVFGDANNLATNRLRRNATHGRYRPAVFDRIADVINDQGGRLSLYWRPSEIDTTPTNPVGSYMLWRRMPALTAQSRLAKGAHALQEGESPAAAGPGAIRVLSDATAITYWEYLSSTPARGWPGYGATVNTESDQIGPLFYVPWEVFMLETVSPTGVVLGTSEPDSGFSMDNLSPLPPASFAALRTGNVTRLTWLPNREPDLRNYNLHRGTSASFVPSNANLIASGLNVAYEDAAAFGFFYKVCAVDVHENSSGYSLVTPAQTLDTPGAPPAMLSFAPVAPSPARDRATLSFALPTAEVVQLGIYDAQGRLVRTLVNGALAAGSHSLAWDLRDQRGNALAPGLYLARLTTPRETKVRRLAVIE